MHTVTERREKLIPMSRIAPHDAKEMDSVLSQQSSFGERRAFDVLMEAQHYWNQMDALKRQVVMLVEQQGKVERKE